MKESLLGLVSGLKIFDAQNKFRHPLSVTLIFWYAFSFLHPQSQPLSSSFCSPALDPTAETNKIFPSPFHLSYVVTLSAHELSTDLHVENPSSNPGGKELKFQALLHSYLRVEDASKIKVKGLKKGLTYIDKVKGQTKETWEGGDLKIEQEVDR